jgi:hypothetical protein
VVGSGGFMAFVPGYEHDVFVSYAHVDDLPFVDMVTGQERSTGWVSVLVRHLKNELAQKIGRADAVSVWFDSHNLRGNHTLLDEIGTRLERSAILVAVLSSGYTASEWCQQEAELFVRAPGDLSRRVFIVEKAPLEIGDALLPAFAGRRAYRFWYRDNAEQPRTFASPVPRPDEIDYFRQVEDLARDLRDHCRVMSGLPVGKSVAPPPVIHSALPLPTPARPSTSVLLAEVTDDLEFKREEVRRYLEQQGASVLPSETYPLGRAEFEAALDSDLARSRVFVQLLGPMPGKRPRDIPDGYGWLQLEGALGRRLPVMQWHSPELDLSVVEWPRHRELLVRETVQATSLEAFKRAIAAALQPPPAGPELRHDGERPLIFLNTEPRHRDIAANIRSSFGDRAVWTEPLFEGPAEIVRDDLEQNIIDCDAMVMVYADNPGWARAQLRNFHKLSCRRDRPVRAIPVIDAPPTEKPELGFFLPEMVMINGRGGIDSDALTQLSATLGL